MLSIIGQYKDAQLLTKADAAAKAATLAASDPDWTYTVEDRGEWAVVKVADEDGIDMGCI